MAHGIQATGLPTKPIQVSYDEIQEIDQSTNLVATYIKSSTNAKTTRIDIIKPTNTNTYARGLLNAFLPAGYPQSVTSDYLEYQVYDSLQAFSSSIAGLLSSRAVLEGLGVGDSHASPTAALLLSVLQESMGRVATILFAHRLGSSLEPECKMYRLLADVFNDAAMVLDCLSPAFPRPVRTALLAGSSVLRALCGVAAGSSKASLSAHFATQGNLGELNAKDSSQETIISLMGMLAGSLVVSYVSSMWATWTLLIMLLGIHLGTNYLAVKAVCMRTLNRQRANLVFDSILSQLTPAMGDLSHQPLTPESVKDFRSPIPEQVRLQENVFERDGVLRTSAGIVGHCQIGVPLSEILKHFNILNSIRTGSGDEGTAFEKLLDIFKGKGYIVWYVEQEQKVLIVLEEGVSPKTMLEAWLFALFVALENRIDIENRCRKETVLESMESISVNLDGVKEKLWREVEDAGWDLETGALETRSGTRIRFGRGDGTLKNI